MSIAPIIMVIRHAEKAAPERGDGVKQSGADDEHSLPIRGWQRAGALVSLFGQRGRPLPDARLAQPSHLIAECPDAPGSEPKKSKREEQTIAPLAEILKLEPNSTFGRGQETEAAAYAKQCTGPVLIVWEHKQLPALAKAITNSDLIPQKWPSDRFDVVFVFRLGSDGTGYSFEQVPQLLLSGDTDLPI